MKLSALFFLLSTLLTTFAFENVQMAMEKRRIGMRLPNLLSLQSPQKRRIGMRLPNIIYLRGEHSAEKKFSRNWN
ncbi:unnamed protein product [Auanema sp. JU1783]|nr:unnamed protein product [Auanema sp. JU1783]